MSGETPITLIGNLVDDPELRYTPAGHAVANFTVASTPRNFDKATGAWSDGETLFMRCNVWRQPAENCAESLAKGMRVILSGSLKQRSFETKEGGKRIVFEVEVEEIGPSLKNTTARVTKMGFNGDKTSGANRSGPANNDPWASASKGFGEDPWVSSPTTNGQDIPPF